jgi:hypothetical protein
VSQIKLWTVRTKSSIHYSLNHSIILCYIIWDIDTVYKATAIDTNNALCRTGHIRTGTLNEKPFQSPLWLRWRVYSCPKCTGMIRTRVWSRDVMILIAKKRNMYLLFSLATNSWKWTFLSWLIKSTEKAYLNHRTFKVIFFQAFVPEPGFQIVYRLGYWVGVRYPVPAP